MKNRVFSSKFKAEVVRRMEAGESPSALAKSHKIRRKLLYEWRDAVLSGTPLRTQGRPKKQPGGETAARESARRIRELEQLVGQLTAENRFFKSALRRVKELRPPSGGTGVGESSRKSKR